MCCDGCYEQGQQIATRLAQHEHTWEQRQNTTSRGFTMPPYQVCECGEARAL